MTCETSTFAGVAVPQVLRSERGFEYFYSTDTGTSEVEARLDVLSRTIAELQIESLEHLDDFRSAGLRDFSLQWLLGNIRVILTNCPLEACEEESLLSLLIFVRGEISAIENVCRQLLG